jgi:lipoprotein NlpI
MRSLIASALSTGSLLGKPLTILSALGAVFFAQIASAQTEQQIDGCNGKGNLSPVQRFSACDVIIQSGKLTGAALARTYYNRGVAGEALLDIDGAAADFNEAVRLDPQAIRLDPKYAQAYSDRGDTRFRNGNMQKALGDFEQALRFDPNLARALSGRGYVHFTNGDFDRAIPDFNRALQIDPKIEGAYFDRGIANLYAGQPSGLAADLGQVMQLNPGNSYAALWLDIASKRSGTTSKLGDLAYQFDMTKWPAPIIRFYLGRSTSDAVMAAANDFDVDTKKGQICEANFYIGEFLLQQGRKDEARSAFARAAADCPKGFTEYAAANAELKQLAPAGQAAEPQGSVRTGAKGWLGVSMKDISDEIATTLGSYPRSGAQITAIHDRGPAKVAGIAPGDVITRVNGRKVENPDDLVSAVGEIAPGDTIDIVLIRRGREETHLCTIGRIAG